MPHSLRRVISHLVGTVALVLLGGCTDTTAPESIGLRFQYSGVEAGAFQASGIPVLNSGTTLVRGSFASAIPDANDTFKVISNDTSGAPFGNMLSMWGVPARPGTYAMPSASPAGMGGGIAFHIGVQWSPTFFSSERLYVLKSGTVTVSEYGPFRVRGTFEGTAQRFFPLGGDPTLLVTITRGDFDVPLSDVAAAQVRCVLFSCPL